jgi:hypothetical protein
MAENCDHMQHRPPVFHTLFIRFPRENFSKISQIFCQKKIFGAKMSLGEFSGETGYKK